MELEEKFEKIPGYFKRWLVLKSKQARSGGSGIRNKEKTHCRYGHQLTDDNIKIVKWNGWTMRQCKACNQRRSQMRGK